MSFIEDISFKNFIDFLDENCEKDYKNIAIEYVRYVCVRLKQVFPECDYIEKNKLFLVNTNLDETHLNDIKEWFCKVKDINTSFYVENNIINILIGYNIEKLRNCKFIKTDIGELTPISFEESKKLSIDYVFEDMIKYEANINYTNVINYLINTFLQIKKCYYGLTFVVVSKKSIKLIFKEAFNDNYLAIINNIRDFLSRKKTQDIQISTDFHESKTETSVVGKKRKISFKESKPLEILFFYKNEKIRS